MVNRIFKLARSLLLPSYRTCGRRSLCDTGDHGVDLYIRKWLDSKVFVNQTLDDFRPFLKNEEQVKKMEWILSQYEMIKYDTSACPSQIPIKRIQDMVEINSVQKLTEYFKFLYSIENRKAAAKLRKEDKRTDVAKALRYAHINDIKLEMGIHFDPVTGAPIYGKWRNGCFIDLASKHEYTAFIPSNLAAVQFGQKLVIDFSYEDCMLEREKKSLVKQMCFGFKLIRESEDPFHLWFCNLNEKGKTYQHLDHNFGWSSDSLFADHFIRRTPQSYLDLFPRNKLVYLCPDSPTDFKDFDHDAVYIIGGLVDRNAVKPVSLAKCKQEGLKHVRLPLDQYLHMQGSKVLTLDQVMQSMVLLKEGKTMEEALKASVPERKVKKPEQVELERNLRLQRMGRQNEFAKSYHRNSSNPNKVLF